MQSLAQHFRKFKLSLKSALPTPVYMILWLIPRYRDFPAIFRFLVKSTPSTTFRQRLSILTRVFTISLSLPCPHTETEVLNFIETVLNLSADSNGVLVEAGCFRGGSTAKFSLAASIIRRELVVFDSFDGIPMHEEAHDRTIFGEPAEFPVGSYCGLLEEVKANVEKFGEVQYCRFVKGWFDATMPEFKQPIAAAYIDVDLASSTATCLKYLYPLLQPGGALYSHDGHLPLVLDVFRDNDFWLNEVGCNKPTIHGLGKRKQLRIDKPSEGEQVCQ